MGEEFAKLLAPWPFLYVLFGLSIFGAGIWSIVRGISGKEGKHSRDFDEQRERWEAYNNLENIEHSVAEIAKSNERLLEATQHLASVMQTFATAIWNLRQ